MSWAWKRVPARAHHNTVTSPRLRCPPQYALGRVRLQFTAYQCDDQATQRPVSAARAIEGLLPPQQGCLAASPLALPALHAPAGPTPDRPRPLSRV
jgi:hypothetical protein